MAHPLRWVWRAVGRCQPESMRPGNLIWGDWSALFVQVDQLDDAPYHLPTDEPAHWQAWRKRHT